MVRQSGKGSWIASLMRQLLKEVRVAPLGVAGRARVVEIHRRSVSKLEQNLALKVVDELKIIALPFCGQERSEVRPGVGQGRRVGRVDRLLDTIETAQFGQRRRQQKRQQSRSVPKAAR
jgi:hypothetical protein